MTGPAEELAGAVGLGPGEVVEGDADGTPCLDVPAAAWAAALRHLRDAWGCTYLDWLSAVDQADDEQRPGVDLVAHVVQLPSPSRPLGRVLLRTRLPASALAVQTATGVYAGAAWHERETHEMFGVRFDGFDDGTGGGLRPLLLPDGFDGTPLRKSFQLASRAAKPWPGAKEPGESDGDAAPSRRKLLPPGVPDATTWGPRRPAEQPSASVASEDGAARATGSSDASGRGAVGGAPEGGGDGA